MAGFPRARPGSWSRHLDSDRLVLSGLVVSGLVVRLVNLTDPPLDGALGRQFHSAFLARIFYLQWLPAEAPWRLEVARAAAPEMLEPPIMELAAAASYLLVGGEYLWIPRLFAIAAWLVGALFLHLVCRRLGLGPGTYAAVAAYLFLPFAIQFSRNFQPEPLMVCLMLASIWALLRHDERPTTADLLVAAGTAAAALLVKPVSLFVIVAVFVGLSARRIGVRRTLRSRETYTFGALAVLPIAVFTAYGFAGGGFLRGQEEGRFMPELILSPSFWLGWARSAGWVITPPILIAALLGLGLTSQGRARVVIGSASVGYAIFALAFSYHASTHTYYHLQLIPLVAIALAAFVDRLWEEPRWRVPVVSACGSLVLLGVVLGELLISSPVVGRDSIPAAIAIGDRTGHSTRAVVVVDRPVPPRWLYYYGEFAGSHWLLAESLAADPGRSPRRTIQRMIRRNTADFLIIADRAQVDQVAGLWKYLRRRLPVRLETDAYVVFDLRSGLSGDQPLSALRRDRALR